MARFRTRLVSAAAAVGLAAAGLIAFPTSAPASSPASDSVAVSPTEGQTVTVQWDGTIPPGSNPNNACTVPGLVDSHDTTVDVPAGLYASKNAYFKFSIAWTPTTPTEDTADEILTVLDPNGLEVGSSDGSDVVEEVNAQNLAPGKYTIEACGFANAAPQPYKGKLEITTKAPEVGLPAAADNGLAFSASTPADPQRDEAEPLIDVDGDGNIYTCGPTGSTNQADYAQVSTDGGDSFHLIGQPPRGQQALGGGGDCGMALGKDRNAGGKFTYAYTGLNNLATFSTATSPDVGHTLNSNASSNSIPGVDRQWMTFVDAQTVLLIYNQQQPHNVVVQKSTDGGLTYSSPDISAPTNPAVVAAPNADFPGPIKYDKAHDLVYFPWTKGDSVYLSVSHDKGATWTDCLAAKGDASTRTGFSTADADNAGNIYIAYGTQAAYHTFMTSVTQDKIAGCNTAVANGASAPKTNPGFSTPVVVDRGVVRTTVFPWLAAGGAPGRVAVAFYGTESDGDPNQGDFKATWDVYVNQSLNGLDPGVTFSQVKATTHPFHYDSICLGGLGCDVSVPAGDRSLADFFAITFSPVTGKLHLVYDQSAKKPDEAAGRTATPAVLNQIAGPSNAGGAVTPDLRAPLRSASADPAGDAQSDYSRLNSGTPTPTNQPASDFTSVSVAPEIDPANGQLVNNGGFTVKMKIADLSDAALQQAMSATQSGSLLWIFRFGNGFTASAASARYDSGRGFTFGYNDYTTSGAQCGSGNNTDKCQQYPGNVSIPGTVDQAAGTITLSVPRSLLRSLAGPTGDKQRPTEVAATYGTRFYDATAFSLGNTSPDQNAQSFLYPLDSTPSFDFLLPRPGTNGGPSIDVAAPGCRGDGYWTVASDGGIFSFGGAVFQGSTGNIKLNKPVVGMAHTPSCGGYWMVATDGGVFNFGDAGFFGSTGNIRLNQPVVGMAPTPTGRGYWMVASDGGIFNFGDAPFLGSMGGTKLNQPVVGMAATPTGKGYWLVARDGGIFSFGDAAFFGSTGNIKLNQPIVSMARTTDGGGYWFVASDGGIFSFGDAPFLGSMGGTRLNKPVVGMAGLPTGPGYWLVASDGGIFTFGGAGFAGSMGGTRLNQPMVGIASH